MRPTTSTVYYFTHQPGAVVCHILNNWSWNETNFQTTDKFAIRDLLSSVHSPVRFFWLAEGHQCLFLTYSNTKQSRILCLLRVYIVRWRSPCWCCCFCRIKEQNGDGKWVIKMCQYAKQINTICVILFESSALISK